MTLKPQVWMNKTNGMIFLATPWFSTGDEETAQYTLTVTDPLDIYFGTFYRVGWLIQNQHGVWFGVNLDAKDSFEVIGDIA